MNIEELYDKYVPIYEKVKSFWAVQEGGYSCCQKPIRSLRIFSKGGWGHAYQSCQVRWKPDIDGPNSRLVDHAKWRRLNFNEFLEVFKLIK